MKKLLSYFVAIGLVVGLAACGSDKPDDLPVSKESSASKSFSLIAAAGTNQSPDVTFNLSDFTSISKYVKYINNADVLPTSYFEIKGLPAGVKLTNVKLSLASNSKKNVSFLNEISSDQKVNENAARELTFLQSVMDEIKTKGSSKVILNYTPSGDLKSDTKFIIQLNTKFSFN